MATTATAIAKVLLRTSTAAIVLVMAANVLFPDTKLAFCLFGIACAVLLLGLFDLVAARHSPARWFVIHAAGNLVVSVGAWHDVVECFRDPVHSFNGRCSLIPALWVPAIHLYHMLAFRLDRADIVHHLLFCSVICPVGLIWEVGVAQSAVGFFISGFPGMLNYMMLALRKHGYITNALTVKVYNARINVWLRAPGLLFCAFCIWVAEGAVRVHWVALVLVGLLLYVNGLYYMQEVCLLGAIIFCPLARRYFSYFFAAGGWQYVLLFAHGSWLQTLLILKINYINI
jgi:hypothetical protein